MAFHVCRVCQRSVGCTCDEDPSTRPRMRHLVGNGSDFFINAQLAHPHCTLDDGLNRANRGRTMLACSQYRVMPHCPWPTPSMCTGKRGSEEAQT